MLKIIMFLKLLSFSMGLAIFFEVVEENFVSDKTIKIEDGFSNSNIAVLSASDFFQCWISLLAVN